MMRLSTTSDQHGDAREKLLPASDQSRCASTGTERTGILGVLGGNDWSEQGVTVHVAHFAVFLISDRSRRSRTEAPPGF